MGSTPRASPQDVAAVAGVDSLPGKGAPAALLELWAGVIWAMLVRSHLREWRSGDTAALLRSTFGVSRESQGLETRRMLGPCSSTASGIAQALPQALLQAMLKHAEDLPCAGDAQHLCRA
jgi:hypothetical protein